MPFQRQGTCSRCGQCCGADGSPNQANPWPKNWPEAIHAWEPTARPAIVQLVGNPGDGDPIGYAIRLGNKTYRSVWVTGVGLCKDVAPFGDPSNYSLECPFLVDDPGDGSRPCALVGTAAEPVYQDRCYPEGPEFFYNQQSLDQWEADHPLCSHTWVEVP